MPTNIKIIHSGEFIRATPEGHLDFAETKKLLIEIANASIAGPLDDYEVILDTRKAHSELTVANLYDLVTELGKFRKTFNRKMAVICPLAQFNNTEFFALCAQNRGFQVSAFTSFAEAWEWLFIEPADEKISLVINPKEVA
jgi:hypothetical protein